MKPLLAHCQLGLAKASRESTGAADREERFRTAMAMYRESDMRYWMAKAEAARSV
jgi:hypothetical protein